MIAWVTVHAFGHMWMFPWGNTVEHAGGKCERTHDYDDLVNYYVINSIYLEKQPIIVIVLHTYL